MINSKRLSSKSSRRSSSRSSSSRSSSRSNYKSSFNLNEKLDKNDIIEINYFTTLVALIFNISVLFYLYNLEGKDCNCNASINENHNLIKIISYVLILLIILQFYIKNKTIKLICKYIFKLLNFINVINIYFYVKELEKTKCNCAIDKQLNIHNALYNISGSYALYIILYYVFLCLFYFVLICATISLIVTALGPILTTFVLLIIIIAIVIIAMFLSSLKF